LRGFVHSVSKTHRSPPSMTLGDSNHARGRLPRIWIEWPDLNRHPAAWLRVFL